MPQPLFLVFGALPGSFVAVGGFSGYRRVTTGSSTLVSCFHPAYLDDLTPSSYGDPLVGLTIEIALDQDVGVWNFRV